MSSLQFWTVLAIWTLILGSLAVFAWFARDLVRLGRTFGMEEENPREREARGS